MAMAHFTEWASYLCLQHLWTQLIHAVVGCDTTSALYGIGKATVFKRITAVRANKTLVHVIQNKNATQDEVIVAGLSLMVRLYKGKPADKLNKLRHEVYCKLSATSSVRPLPQKLPPTEHTALFHVLRVRLQVMMWKKLSTAGFDPSLWGWQIDDGHYEPIMSDHPPAPDELLNVVRCKCKSDCKSSLCSCRRNGLTCVTACAGCHRQSCRNRLSSASHPPSAAGFEHDISLVSNDSTDLEVMYDSDVDWISEEIIESVDTYMYEVYARFHVALSQGIYGSCRRRTTRQCVQLVPLVITVV